MIPREWKRLAEVDFPIAVVSDHAVREKSGGSRHPFTLHREILSEVRQPPVTDLDLRKALLWFIGAFSNWDMAAHSTYLRVGRNLVRAAHGEEAPLVVDPFAGGGSIPLEALRLGCEAFASDLNPVACLILKVLLEDIPRHGPGLADELRRVGGVSAASGSRFNR